MRLADIIEHIKRWASTKFTGVVTIHFHEGGIRKVRLEHDIK
jgi:hypothetical protein